jgi:hypothetical protein
MKRRSFLARGGLLAAGLTSSALVTSRAFASDAETAHLAEVAARAEAATPHSDADMIRKARAAFDQHASHITHRDLLGVVNFAQHSSQLRFQLVDLQRGSVECFLVAHGAGSDPEQTGWLKRFSNAHGSLATSQGSYVTGEEYDGQYGRSRRLVGLDSENSEAYNRAIVIHGASFVSADRAKKKDVGCSFGCFAFALADINTILNRLGPGRLLLAYKA